MTAANKKDQEYLILDNTVDLPLRLDAGECEGRFLKALRDEKRIWANKCPKCGRQLVVPRPVCAHCYDVEMTEWVEQGDEGVLEHFSISYYPFVHPRTGKIKPVPWANGIIRLDGGAQIWHEVVPPDPAQLKIGDRYKAVWKEEGRTGFIWDILHFEKVASDAPAKALAKADKEPPQLKEPHSLPGMLKVTYHHAPVTLPAGFLLQ